MEDFTVNKLKNGSYEIFGTFQGSLINEQYFGYTKKECILLFKEQYNIA